MLEKERGSNAEHPNPETHPMSAAATAFIGHQSSEDCKDAYSVSDSAKQEREPDRDQIAHGLTLIGLPVLLCTIDPDSGTMGPARTFVLDEREAATAWAVEQSRNGLGVFWHPNATRLGLRKKAEKSDVEAARFVHADIDPEKGKPAWSDAEKLKRAATLEALPCPPSFILTSGSGLHPYWRLDAECQNIAAIERINQGVRDAVGADSGTWNIDRIMRVPGTWNWPSARKRAIGRVPTLAGVISDDSGLVYEAHTLAAAFPVMSVGESQDVSATPRQSLGLGAITPLTTADLGIIATPELMRAVDRPAGGDRSGDVVYAACAGLRAGLYDHEVAGLLSNPTNPVSAHVLDQPDQSRAIERAIQAAHAKEPDAQPIAPETREAVARLSAGSFPTLTPPKRSRAFEFVHIGDLPDTEPDFIVEGLLESSSLGLLFGDPGCGKSFVALDLACCIATGTAFHGRDVKQGAVFYVAGEGHGGLKRRFRAWEMGNVQSLADKPVFTSRGPANFLDADSAARVAEAVITMAGSHGPPRLIIIDTLARNFGDGDENSTKDMNAFVAAMDGLRADYPEATILIVHHTGHIDKGRARGSIALKGALDAEYQITKSENLITITNKKMKEAAPPPRISLRCAAVELGRDKNGNPYESLYLESHDAADITAGLTTHVARLKKQDSIGIETFAQLEQASLSSGNPEGVLVEDWREAFYEAHGGAPGSARVAFYRVRDALLSSGAMSAEGDLIRVRDGDYRLHTGTVLKRNSGTWA